jgi:hypothetical protein
MAVASDEVVRLADTRAPAELLEEIESAKPVTAKKHLVKSNRLLSARTR